MTKKISPPPTINLVRQPKNTGLCVAASVAMVTGETLAVVVRESTLVVEPPDFEAWMTDYEASRFLATRKLGYGLADSPSKKLTGRERSFAMTVPLDKPAIITVESLVMTEGHHSVVWCPVRRKVMDPQKPEPQDISRYTVIHWAVIYSLEFEE